MENTDKKKMASITRGCAILSVNDFDWVVLAWITFIVLSVIDCSVLIEEPLVTPVIVESIWMHLHKVQNS